MNTTARIKDRLCVILKQRGVRGLSGLLQAFRDADQSKNGYLSWEEFCTALQRCGLAPSPQDLRALFLEFDKDGSNEISFQEFVSALRGSLSAKRRNIITRIFEGIDTDRDGVISMTDIGSCYQPKNHPDVKYGRTTVSTLLSDFFETFNTVTNNGYVTLEQFLEYYANAAFYETDQEFEESMGAVWKVDNTTGNNSSVGNSSSNLPGKSLKDIAKARDKGDTMSSSQQGGGRTIAPLEELRRQLAARGASGIIGLARKFRIMDDDGSKSLNMAEFKKGVRECSLDLNEQELNQLFQHFDKDRSGSLDYDEFLRGLRGVMSDRRKTLVGMAFTKLDKNGTGEVDPEDVIDVYDASKHPDVIAGKKTPAAVLREFLDTFDVGGEKDGKVTRNEFENYYSNVSSSIDDDDYFELMIRNAWHISGGTGWSANSANRRVLVTHADGRQTVEEIKDDLGLKSDDKAGMMARLRAQGVNASNISLTDGVDNTTKGRGKKPDSASLLGRYNEAAAPPEAGSGRRSFAQPASKVAFAMAASTPGGETPRPASSSGKSNQNTPNAGLQMIIQKLKGELKARGGGSGFIGLQRKFRIMDDDGSKALNLAEFKKAMKEMNMNLSDSELRMLFDHFDSDRSGSIDFEEFIQGVRDPLTERRKKLVHMAFTVLDTVGDGLVDVNDVIGRYDASKHPDVIAGKKSANKVLEEFLDTFDVGGEKDGKVSRTEFENYYTNIGANIDNDDYFELMIRNAWHISGGTGWSANSANRRVLVTHADGRQTVEEIKNDLGLKSDDKAGMMARLRAQGVNASNISLTDGVDNTTQANRSRPPSSFGELVGTTSAGRTNAQQSEKQVGKKRPENSKMYASSIHIGDDGTKSTSSSGLNGGIKRTNALYASTMNANSASTDANTKIPHTSSLANISLSRSKDIRSILSNLKEQLATRGARGIIGLSRKFKIMDDDGSGALSFSEFKKGIRECSLDIQEDECRQLFATFDKDGSGEIVFDEFLQGVRGDMSDRRKTLVGMAFTKLDKNGTGEVDPEDIIDIYDATKHPDVIAGKKSSDEVFREFLDTFDVGGEKDGKVTRNEFENYYSNVSSSIDNDDYFELMIRNAWHISGGTGWSANSANRRVLVTHADGRQTVEEIKDDLGLKSDDKAGMMARLRAQGVNASNISLTDGVDNTTKGKGKSPTYTSQIRIG